MTVFETAEFLRAHDNFLILTHTRPDGDTVGSAAGLCRALRPAQSADRYPYDDPHGGAVHIRSPRIPSFMPAASARFRP